MQNKDIEIFLELVNTRNITKTSENLFMSQSVISTRLKKLETELGYELFTRTKGMREIELTRAGREFISMAQRWKNLYEEAALLKVQTEYVFRIASPESVYFDFLEPVLMHLLRDNPELKIDSQTCDSSEVYSLMEQGTIDIGFASYESSHTGISHSHVYTQRFCLVTSADGYPEDAVITPDMLDPSKEIRLTGGNLTNVSQWTDTWFSGNDRCRVEVNSPHMIVKCLKELGGWTILPTATAEMLSKLYGVSICKLAEAPESRKIYLLRHTKSQFQTSDAVKLFECELKRTLEEKNKNTEVH